MPSPSVVMRTAMASALAVATLLFTSCTTLFDPEEGTITNKHILSGRPTAEGGPNLGPTESSITLKDPYLDPLEAQINEHIGVIARLLSNVELKAKGAAVQYQGETPTVKVGDYNRETLSGIDLLPALRFADLATDLGTLCQNDALGSQIFPEDEGDDEGDENGIKNLSGPCKDIEQIDTVRENFNKLSFYFQGIELAWRSTDQGPALEMKTRFSVTEDQKGLSPILANIHWSRQTFTTLIRPKYCGHCSQEPCTNANRPLFRDPEHDQPPIDLAPVDLEVISVESSGDLELTNPICAFIPLIFCGGLVSETDAYLKDNMERGITGIWGGLIEQLLNPINLTSPPPEGVAAAAATGATALCNLPGATDPVCSIPANIRNDLFELLEERAILDLGQSDFRINRAGGGSTVARLGAPGGAFGPNTFAALNRGATLETAALVTTPAIELCRSRTCEASPDTAGCEFCSVCRVQPALCQGVPAVLRLPAANIPGLTAIPAVPAAQWLMQGAIPTSAAIRNWFQAPFASEFPRRFGKSLAAKADGTVALTIGTARTDGDEDGVPNLCDRCPGVRDQDHVPIDFDGDRIYDTCDNCPFVADDRQANSNVESELVLGLARQGIASSGIGDWCDPAPTPLTTVRESEGTVTRSGAFSIVSTSRNLFRVRGLQAEEEPRSLRTGFRFCSCPEGTADTMAARLTCQNTRLCRLASHNLYSSTGSPWQRMNMTGLATSTTDEGLVSYAQPIATIDQAPPKLTTCRGINGTPLGTAEVPGVVWTHAVGPSNGNLAADLLNRSNDYLSGRLFGTKQTIRQEIPLIDWSRYLPVIRGNIDPVPWFSEESFVGLARDNTPWVRTATGAYAMPTGFGASAVAALKQSGVRWFAASEPERLLPDYGVAYVGLTSGTAGLRIASRLRLSASAIDAMATSTPPTGTPAPAPALSTYIGAHSINENKLWIFGKRGSVSELWVHDFELGQWQQIPETLALGEPLAIAYDAQGRTTYLLDAALNGFITNVRLVRIQGDALQVMASWPKVLWNATYEMKFDGADALFIAASTTLPEAHALARFSRSALAWSPSGFAAGFGKIEPGALIASEAGANLIVRSGTSSSQVNYSVTAMAPLGPQELQRCF